jgi:hypothetical protein
MIISFETKFRSGGLNRNRTFLSADCSILTIFGGHSWTNHGVRIVSRTSEFRAILDQVNTPSVESDKITALESRIHKGPEFPIIG